MLPNLIETIRLIIVDESTARRNVNSREHKRRAVEPIKRWSFKIGQLGTSLQYWKSPEIVNPWSPLMTR